MNDDPPVEIGRCAECRTTFDKETNPFDELVVDGDAGAFIPFDGQDFSACRWVDFSVPVSFPTKFNEFGRKSPVLFDVDKGVIKGLGAEESAGNWKKEHFTKQLVWKYGVTTGLTFGRSSRVEFWCKNLENPSFFYHKLVGIYCEAPDEGQFALKGDSGALVCAEIEEGQRALGLITGYTEEPLDSVAFFSQLSVVEKELGVRALFESNSTCCLL